MSRKKKVIKIAWMGHMRDMNKDLQIRKGGVGVFWQCNLNLGCTVSIYNVFILNDCYIYQAILYKPYKQKLSKMCSTNSDSE